MNIASKDKCFIITDGGEDNEQNYWLYERNGSYKHRKY